MSSHEGGASGRQSTSPRRAGRRIGTLLERWPFGRKLHLLVLVPVVVIAAMLAYVVGDELTQARDAADTATLVRDSESVATLIDDLQSEHRQALLLSVRHQAAQTGGAGKPSDRAYVAAQRRTDAQVRRVRASFGSRLPAAEADAVDMVGGLSDLRRMIGAQFLPADNIDPTYIALGDQLIEGLGLTGSGNSAHGSAGSRLEALLGADAAHAAFETAVFGAQSGDANALNEFLRAVGDHRRFEDRSALFKSLSSQGEGAQVDGIERSSQQRTIEDRYNALRVDPSALQSGSTQQLRASIDAALKAEPQFARQAEDRLRITHTLIDRIAAQADEASGNAWRRALLLLAAAVLALALWLLFSFLVRRSVARPVRVLTAAAQQVADATGRELARVADDESAETRPPSLREIPVPVRDEIGTLAETFNQVQSAASALLERQIVVRGNVEKMFGNIGHRVSNLVSRQLDLIEGLEKSQTSPELLRPLYQIDNIATRLRRNAESLQVIASRRGSAADIDAQGPTSLADVLRAAQSTIEGYERVTLRPSAEVAVAPAAVGDLTLMLAELLQNGVYFSPAHTTVDVAVQVRLPAEGAVIEIIDHGLGIPADQLVEENARLLSRERLDLAPTNVLGLFVVGRIARRFGIGVVLTRTPGEGLTSTVTIPAELLLPAEVVPAPAGPPPAPTPPAGPSGLPRPALVAATPHESGLPKRVSRRGAERSARPETAQDVNAPAAPVPAPAPRGSGDQPRHDQARRDPAHPEEARSDRGPGDGPRPLRRRVRGATLTPAADRPAGASLERRGPVDPARVRSELEDLEAATERARADSTRETTVPVPRAPHTPEGSGNDGRPHHEPGDSRRAR
ncbi:ATP-binding protein [Streptomyces sp. NPDC007088]|uniref:sensor histidine kinase n=1 Tax=Streptomyces sp. NPDC007088 TaxID=3364773 RepID=UPI00367F03E1